MLQILLVVVAVLLIAAVHDLAPRIHVAPALVLVVIGALVGIPEFVPAVEIDPEWILVGVLPPLLYAAAVSMPTMDFRRDFWTISALSVVLVLISAVALGFFFHWVIPGIGLATGIALGAIVSPTDAVATSIAKRMGAPARVTAVLEGESMLNDASALVLLRAAVAAIASSVSFGGVALNFAWAVVAAVAVGGVVGVLNLMVRSRVSDPTVNTAISFTVPFLAYLPAEGLKASGLVAAVTAGLITGAGAARYLTPQHRLSDTQNWRTVELILEGGVFLLMGLELFGLMTDVQEAHDGVARAVWIGLAALGVMILIRAVYVAPLGWLLNRAARRGSAMLPHLQNIDDSITSQAKTRKLTAQKPDGTTGSDQRQHRGVRRRIRRELSDAHKRGERTDLSQVGPETARFYRMRVRRQMADIDYYLSAPLGPKEGTLVVWAGMRGVVTLAAAQTLPPETHSRSLLVLIAFVVAASSLLLQGGTLPWLIRTLRLADTTEEIAAERDRLRAEMARTAQRVMTESDAVKRFPWLRERIEQLERESDDDEQVSASAMDYRAGFEQTRRAIIDAQRKTLLLLRKQGTYSSALLTRELKQLDAEEISLDMRTEE